MSRRPPSSILIVRLSAIGDVVHGLATLDALHAALPDTRFGWLVEELSAPLLENHPALDKIYIIPRKRWRGKISRVFFSEIVPFFREIRRDGWEATLDLQGITKSAVAAKACGAKIRAGHGPPRDREFSRFFYNRRASIKPTDIQVAQEALRLVECFDLSVPDPPPLGTINLLDGEKEAARERLREIGWSGEEFFQINPGSAWPSKRWPLDKFAEMARLLHERTGLRPMVLWGPGEEKWRDQLASDLADLAPLVSPATRTIRELATFISFASLFLGNDTGPTHIASVLRVPVICVFGASLCPRNSPWTGLAGDEMAVSVQRSELPCIQCLKRNCPLDGDKHFACLNGLEPSRVFQAAEPLLDHHFPRIHEQVAP
ncbi:MAG: glycosyltransferase family 9 protein [Candidatus Sumerlaeia bacterium]|nr:glycosyltransferase family 9 protein [Candidatus Sumerlaeia bacterium]